MQRVYLFDDMGHGSAQMEVGVKCFDNESDLSMGAKVLMVFAQGVENRFGSRERYDDLVISA